MSTTYRIGPGPWGLEFMKFTLTYEGELPSNGNHKAKWNIRKQFHPQLQELWRTHPALKNALANRIVPKKGSFTLVESHHSSEEFPATAIWHETMDLCESFSRGGFLFYPLVRESFALRCGLKITFLRREEPGKIYQGGDLDNRLKTLFDALAMPDEQQVVNDVTIDQPIYCLLEDDRFITNCTVETHRLLSKPNSSIHEVHLLVEVDVRVTQTRELEEKIRANRMSFMGVPVRCAAGTVRR